MKTRPLSKQERDEIAQRYGAKCDVTRVTVCKPGATSAWEDIMNNMQRRMKAARERKRGKKDE